MSTIDKIFVPLSTHIFCYHFQLFADSIIILIIIVIVIIMIAIILVLFLLIDMLPCCKQYLAAGSLPVRLPITLNKLRMLALDVDLASPEEASLTRLLLQNAPNLEELNLVHIFPN